jgi:hypothetical protein
LIQLEFIVDVFKREVKTRTTTPLTSTTATTACGGNNEVFFKGFGFSTEVFSKMAAQL